MELKLYKSFWGMSGTLEEKLEKIAEAGYFGVEAMLPSRTAAPEFRRILEQYGLDYIPMIYTDNDHKASYRERLERAIEFNPRRINCHSSKDWMAFDEQRDFFDYAMKAEQELGFTVAHETHRSRATFSAWHTARLLREFPEMRLSADFSHWVVVSESLLEDQREHVALAIDRTIHVHTRVGFRHGPQVPDPRAPEYSEELEAHAAWWDDICRAHHARGESEVTMDPEFGPPGYMHTLPYTLQPVADLWQICLWMADFNRARFDRLKLN